MEKHFENIRKFGQPCVVAINHFPTDASEEVRALEQHCRAWREAVEARPFSEGGPGCRNSPR
jgi:formate--tetrahydrofolate ligase